MEKVYRYPKKRACGRKRLLSITQMNEIAKSKLSVKDLAEKYKVGLNVMYDAIRDRNLPHANFIHHDQTAA